MSPESIRKHLIRNLIACISISAVLINLSGGLARTFSEYSGDASKRIEINYRRGDADAAFSGRFPPDDAGRAIGLDHIDLLQQRYDDCQVSYSSELSAQLEYDNRIADIKAVLCDSSSYGTFNISMMEGSFFQEKDEQYGLNVVVISEKLSVDLFSGYNAVGNKLGLFGQIYTVVGVYKTKSSILTYLNSDGTERVYLPYRSVADYQEIPVKSVVISGESLENETFRLEKLEHNLTDILNSRSFPYRTTDFYVKAITISQARDIIVFVIFIFSFVLLIRQTKEYIKKCISQFSTVSVLKIAAAIAGLSVVLLIIIKFALPDVYIDPSFVPYDNIFDISFYLNQIKEAITTGNINRINGLSHLESCFSSAMMLNALMLVLFIIFFLFSASNIKLLTASGFTVIELIEVIIISFTAGNTAAIILSYSAKLVPAVSIVPFLALLMFCICYSKNHQISMRSTFHSISQSNIV